MIECNACGDWNHHRCEELTEELVARIQLYACKDCIASGLASTKYKAGDGEAAADGSANGPDYAESSTAGGKRRVALRSTLESAGRTKTKMSLSSLHNKSPADAAPAQHDNGSKTNMSLSSPDEKSSSDAAPDQNDRAPKEASGTADTNVTPGADTQIGPTNADIFKVLRTRRQFQDLRQVALQQPETMESILQRLVISEYSLAQQFLHLRRVHLQQPPKLLPILQDEAIAHSKVAKLIAQDPEQFLRLLTENINGGINQDNNQDVEEGGASRAINGNPVPGYPNLSAYKQIVDKLTAKQRTPGRLQQRRPDRQRTRRPRRRRPCWCQRGNAASFSSRVRTPTGNLRPDRSDESHGTERCGLHHPSWKSGSGQGSSGSASSPLGRCSECRCGELDHRLEARDEEGRAWDGGGC
jgi:hypothetical protein